MKYGFRHAWRDGTCGVLLDPLDFLARLAALIPPPKFHMLRYHGVLAAHAKDEAAGIRRIHNHCTRHSFASHAVMRGIPIRQVQEWLGHGSIVVTMRYAHLAHGIGDDLIRRLAPTPDDAARSQHIHSTKIWRTPNSAPQTPIEPLD